MPSFEKQKKMPGKASPSSKKLDMIHAELDKKIEMHDERVRLHQTKPSFVQKDKKIEKPVEKKKITKPKKRLRLNLHPKKKAVLVPEALPEQLPDVIAEQKEPVYTTQHCPESVKDMKLIKQTPEDYLEINVIKKSRVVDTFAIPVDNKVFHYKTKEYKIVEEGIYLLPTKAGLLMPSSFYREGIYTPTGFKNTNKGITGKALSLLYMEQLYTSLLYAEDTKYNLFIVILLIACLIAFGIGAYFVFMHGGGMLTPPPSAPEIPVGLIM